MADYQQETTITVILPHNREAEEATIGAVLINPDIYYDCAAIVRANDFYIHRNKWIWESISRLMEQRQPVDVLTVTNELDRSGHLNEIGGPAYITSLINQVPSSLNAEAYAGMVRGTSIRRNIIQAANRIAEIGYDENMSIERSVDTIFEVVEQAVDGAEISKMRHISDILSEHYDRMDQLSKLNDDDKPIIKTNLADLDKYLRIRPGNVITIAGRPGVGKTGVGLTIAVNVSRKGGKNVALFVLEMSSSEIADRITAMETDINLFHLMDGKLEERDWPLYTYSVESMSATNLFINDDPDITVSQIRAHCKKLKTRYGLDLVIIDYLQLIESPGENRVQQVSYTTRQIKKMARALDVPVIQLSQMSRDVEKRGDKKPVMSDLRESGSIEQDSDSVIFLYIKDEGLPTDPKQLVRTDIAKQRNGPRHDFDLAMHKETTRFDNATNFYTK